MISSPPTQFPNDENREIILFAMELISSAKVLGISVRLLGGIAIWLRAGSMQPFMTRYKRSGDLDLVVHARDRYRFESWVASRFDLYVDRSLASIPNQPHGRFYRVDSDGARRICDVTYDRFEYNHDLDLRDRMEIDEITIPLAELLITKLQIVEPQEKDIVDIIVLLLAHELGESDRSVINLPIILRYCARDWGLTRTMHQTLCGVCIAAIETFSLPVEQRTLLFDRALQLIDRIDNQVKRLRWRWRCLRGPWDRWYTPVYHLADPSIDQLRN